MKRIASSRDAKAADRPREMIIADGPGAWDIGERALDFAAASISFCKGHPEKHNDTNRIVFRQFLRAATSIGANVEEARSGESRADFIHKYAIAQKEAREALYWLRLIQRSKLASGDCILPLEKECNELLAILTAILVKTKAGSKGAISLKGQL